METLIAKIQLIIFRLSLGARRICQFCIGMGLVFSIYWTLTDKGPAAWLNHWQASLMDNSYYPMLTFCLVLFVCIFGMTIPLGYLFDFVTRQGVFKQ